MKIFLRWKEHRVNLQNPRVKMKNSRMNLQNPRVNSQNRRMNLQNRRMNLQRRLKKQIAWRKGKGYFAWNEDEITGWGKFKVERAIEKMPRIKTKT